MTAINPINLRKFDKTSTLELTVTVNFTREFRVRMWLGMRLAQLAAWVMGMGFKSYYAAGDDE